LWNRSNGNGRSGSEILVRFRSRPSPSVACREPLGEPYTRRTETDGRFRKPEDAAADGGATASARKKEPCRSGARTGGLERFRAGRRRRQEDEYVMTAASSGVATSGSVDGGHSRRPFHGGRTQPQPSSWSQPLDDIKYQSPAVDDGRPGLPSPRRVASTLPAQRHLRCRGFLEFGLPLGLRRTAWASHYSSSVPEICEPACTTGASCAQILYR